jgi:ATP-dependent DNA helicase DinG
VVSQDTLKYFLSTHMKYILLDFETTGLDAATSEIIEIGAILVDGFEAQARFHAFVRPLGEIPPAIVQLTRITPEMLAGERNLPEVLPSLVEFLGGYPIVAHNASLEQNFLDHHVVPGAGRTFTVHNSIEPLALLLPDLPSHSMESMRRWAGLDGSGAHRADQDCEDLLRVLQHAHQWMWKERASVAAIVNRFLAATTFEDKWWWSWLFGGNDAPIASDTPWLDRPFRGDLRELKGADSSREIDWSKAIPAGKVHDALARPPSGQAGFQYRETQERMAQEVRDALTEGKRIAIEAPTGTGKSVAYLVPGLLAARASQAPLVVSTHSKGLQDQLLEKDMPIARALLVDSELKATTVKGQENYLCLRKLNDLAESVSEEATLEERWCLAYLLSFASVSQVAELDRLSHYLKVQFPSLAGMADRVRSHYTTTQGPTCAFHKQCHFFDSARLAHGADVIIANHSLVFQWPAHLPQIRNVVFDEAHHLEDQITEAYSIRLREEELADSVDRLCRKQGARRTGDTIQVSRLMGRLELPERFRDLPPGEKIAALTDQIRARLLHARQTIPLGMARTSAGVEGYEESVRITPQIRETIENLAGAVQQLKEYLAEGVSLAESGSFARTDPALDALKTSAWRFESYEQKLRALIDETKENSLRLLHWNPRENVWRLSVAPIEVAELSQPFFDSKRAIVLTSATLSTGQAQDFVTSRIGLKPSRPLLNLPSPYRLKEQARVWIPSDIAQPGTPGHLDALIEFTEQVASSIGGRTLLLITSNKRLKIAAERLREKLEHKGITVMDSLSDRRAADHFRATERALLVGSERYGEGLDIPGRALSCVIVEKINEAMTRSPLAEARKARTRFGLYDYDFPLRMMWLKQRVGRLIRSSTDTGSVVVFDARYHGWSAGSRRIVDQALAPIPVAGGTREQIVMAISRQLGE